MTSGSTWAVTSYCGVTQPDIHRRTSRGTKSTATPRKVTCNNKIAQSRPNSETGLIATSGDRPILVARTIVQPYLLGGANVHAHLIHDFSTHHAKQQVDQFSRFCTADAVFSLFDARHRPYPVHMGPCLIHRTLGATRPILQPNFDLVSHFFTIRSRLYLSPDRSTDRQTDRSTSTGNNRPLTRRSDAASYQKTSTLANVIFFKK